MKKVAVISNTFPPFSGGGVATAQYNILKKLEEAGFKAKGYTFFDHGKIKLQEDNIKRFGSPKFIFRTINTITKFYFSKNQKKDCSTNFEYAWQYSFTLNSAIGCWKINREFKKFNPDIVIMPDLGAPNFYIKRPSKDCKMILVSHHNALRFINNPLIDKHSELDAKLVNDLENRGMKNIDKVICPSSYMKEFFGQSHNFNGPTEVIPNFINETLIESSPKIDIRKELSLPEDAPLIYMPAANTPVKGPRYMFEIIRRLSKYYEKPVGFYLSAGVTEELSYELQYLPPNTKIYAPGFLEYSKNIGVIKSCDFGITPTLLESFGMAILEASFCGVPFISFDCEGNSDIINNEEDGFLIDYLDIEGMIEKAQLLLSDKSKIKEISSRTKSNAYNEYNSEVTLNKLLSSLNLN